jgi:hypothetical protein
MEASCVWVYVALELSSIFLLFISKSTYQSLLVSFLVRLPLTLVFQPGTLSGNITMVPVPAL